MRERIITLTLFLLLCVPFEMQGQGRNIVKGVIKGMTFRSYAPLKIKVGKPWTLETAFKESSSDWIITKDKYNYIPNIIDINRHLPIGTRLILEQKATTGFSKDTVNLLMANPVQNFVWSGDETELFSDCRLLDPLPSGITGFQIEQILRKEGDSTPITKNSIDIEVEYKAGKAKGKAKETKEKRAKNTKKHLFFSRKEDFDTVRTKCRDEFLGFLKHEGFINEHIEPNRYSNIAMSFVSFYRRWRKEGYVPKESGVNGAACYRFLTIDCGLNSSTDEKAFGKFIHRTLEAVTEKNGEDVETVEEKKINDWLLTHGATN